MWTVCNFVDRWYPENAFQPTEWTWLADSLIQAAAIDPHTIVPQFVTLVVKTNESGTGERYYWTEETEAPVREMFGDNFKRMVELIAETELDVSSFDDEAKRIITFAQEHAKWRLAEWEGESPDEPQCE